MTLVLLVDSEDDPRRALREFLQAEGFEVAEASDGRQALQYLATRPADLVITDIVMPEMEGLELISWLRREHPKVVIIALSRKALSSTTVYLRIADRLGADRTFPKPYCAADLLQAIHELLGK